MSKPPWKQRRARIALSCGVLTGLLALGCQASGDGEGLGVERVSIGAVLWYVDYDAAVEVAREQDKALWVHFGENPG